MNLNTVVIKMTAIIRPTIGSAVLEFLDPIAGRPCDKTGRKRGRNLYAHVRSEEPCKIHTEGMVVELDKKV
jgi:hypothetical protein